MIFSKEIQKIKTMLFASLIIISFTIGIMGVSIYRLKEENVKLKHEISKIETNYQYASSKSPDELINSLKSHPVVEPSDVNIKPVIDMHISIPTGIKIMDVVATAYTPSAGGINCSGNCNNTAKLFKVSAIEHNFVGVTYCAVDPNVIPFYSIIIVQGFDKPCVAVDTGGAIKGNHIDILINDHKLAKKWGKRNVKAIIIPPDVYTKQITEYTIASPQTVKTRINEQGQIQVIASDNKEDK